MVWLLLNPPSREIEGLWHTYTYGTKVSIAVAFYLAFVMTHQKKPAVTVSPRQIFTTIGRAGVCCVCVSLRARNSPRTDSHYLVVIKYSQTLYFFFRDLSLSLTHTHTHTISLRDIHTTATTVTWEIPY